MLKKKSLGQNFLKSPHILADIVSSGKIEKGDLVLEIGPGEGTLTEKILETGVGVVCVEKDDRLIPVLEKKFEKEIAEKRLRLIHADILNIDINTLIKGKYKLIANIPYYVTGQIIRMFLESDKQPLSMTILVQKEVAERIVAKDKKESLLSLSVKAFGEPKYIRTVGRGAFTPQPNVDSAVISIENISNKRFKNVTKEDFFKTLHAGFAHKRKQLLPNLSSLYSKEKIEKSFGELKINAKSRAEDIDIDTWIKFCNIIS